MREDSESATGVLANTSLLVVEQGDWHSVFARKQATHKEDARPRPARSSQPALRASNAKRPVVHPDPLVAPAQTPADIRWLPGAAH